jgi:hypothetical protein
MRWYNQLGIPPHLLEQEAPSVIIVEKTGRTIEYVLTARYAVRLKVCLIIGNEELPICFGDNTRA